MSRLGGWGSWSKFSWNWLYNCFWERGVIYQLLLIERLLFLADIIPGQWLALMCNCIVRAIFNRAFWKSSLKIYLLLLFLNHHPNIFRICSREDLTHIKPNFESIWTAGRKKIVFPSTRLQTKYSKNNKGSDITVHMT